jgi:hypothetical protein
VFSFFKRSPRFEDEAFADLALMLTRDEDNPTFRRELLAADKLDFSVESLKHVDAYLGHLHKAPPQGKDFMRVMLRCGAYVGEVLRRHSRDAYHWIGYDEAAKLSERVKGFERSTVTEGILWKDNETMCFPLGKVVKYIENGEEDSVHFYVEVLLKRDAAAHG